METIEQMIDRAKNDLRSAGLEEKFLGLVTAMMYTIHAKGMADGIKKVGEIIP